MQIGLAIQYPSIGNQRAARISGVVVTIQPINPDVEMVGAGPNWQYLVQFYIQNPLTDEKLLQGQKLSSNRPALKPN